MIDNMDAIKKKALPILRDAGVKCSSLFGSVVRGEAKKGSDIDILIEPPQKMSLFGFIELQQSLEAVLKRKVDLGEYSTIKPRLKDSILKSAVQIL